MKKKDPILEVLKVIKRQAKMNHRAWWSVRCVRTGEESKASPGFSPG